jgi:hypothetical protein
MVAVAVVGALLGASIWLERRRAEFKRLAEMYGSSSAIVTDPHSKGYRDALLYLKYERAARRPWLPVPPDPPEPE